MLRSTFLLLALHLTQLTAAVNVGSWYDLAEKHSWVDTPRGWVLKSTAPPAYPFLLRIGLKSNGMDKLVSNLMEISDPGHHRYAQHLTQKEVATFTAPHPDTVEVVDSWLTFHGVDPTTSVERTHSGDWISLNITIEQAEKMLGAEYNVYRHDVTGEEVVRTLSYSLPKALHSHIDVVAPTTYFSTLRSMRTTSFLQPEITPLSLTDVDDALRVAVAGAIPSSCSTTITPACLRELYNTTSYVPVSAGKNSIGVAGYLQEYANNADLQTFFKRFRTDAVGHTFTTVQVNGGLNDQTDPGVEANLDIQYTTGMGYPTPNIYYSTGGSPPFIPDSQTPTNTNEPYLEFLNFLLSQSKIPQVLTTSYGDDEQTVPKDYAIKVCDLFAQLGSLGTTVFFSSGDFGVGGGDCLTNDGTKKKIFQPAFPASCPWVTAVGGTTRVNPEVAVSFSGGGFSRYFTRPSYQNSVVSSFVTALGTKFAGMYNATGRAYPDLAAQGNGFQVVIGGRVQSVGGTSASSPTVAGVFALLNDYRLAINKTSLGFINPLIYSTASSGFNDITSGSNPGCGTTGFTARKRVGSSHWPRYS